MSYEIVKTLTIDTEKLTARFASASNNVWPKTYEPFTYEFKRREDANAELSDLELFILDLIQDVEGGMLKLTSSVSVKVRYAFHKVRQSTNQLREDGLYLYNYLSDVKYRGANTDIAKELVKTWLDAFNEKDEKIKSLILMEGLGFFAKSTRSGVRYVGLADYAEVFTSQKKLELRLQDLKDRFGQYEIKAITV